MKSYRNIIEDIKEPSPKDLWLNNGELKYFGPNGWVPIFDSKTGLDIDGLPILGKLNGDEYIPVSTGISNKKVRTDMFAYKTDIPDVSGFITSSQADGKYATLAQIGDIETILDNIIGG